MGWSPRSVFILSLGLVAAGPGLARAADPDQGPQSHTVAGVTVTAAPNAPLTATFTESTVPREQLERLSPTPTMTVQTLLNSQPSIFAYADGPFGVRTNIYFRAFNSGEFSETYDGVALNDVFNAAVTGGAENANNGLLQPQDLDSVEVFRGVNNPAVNAYNSLGGTINFIPKQPTADEEGEIEASFGSFGTYQARATLNTGDFHGLRQSGSLAFGRTAGWQLNTEDWNYNFDYAATYDIAANQALRLFSVVNHNQGAPSDNIPTPLLEMFGRGFQWPTDVHSHQINNTNWLGILDYENDTNDQVTFDNKFFAGWDSYKRVSFTNANIPAAFAPYSIDDGPTFPFWLPMFSSNYMNGPTYSPGDVFGTGVFDYPVGEQYHFYGYETWGFGDTPTLTLNLPRNKIVIGANVTWGGLWSREYWWGTPAVPLKKGFNDAWDEWDTRILGSVYAQDEFAIIPETLFVTPGVKYLYAHTSDTDNVGFFYPLRGKVKDNTDFISPTLGLSYKPFEGFDVYAAFGQNIKFPNISAFYGAFQTDANGDNVIVPVKIRPEHVNDYELGARYQRGGFHAEVDVYREDFTNTFISQFNPVTNLTTTHNGGASRYQGVEVQLKDEMRWMDADWSGYFNYAHNEAKFTTGFTDQESGNSVLPGTPLANVPSDLVSAGLDWSWNGWQASAAVRYVGRQFIEQAQLGTVTTPLTIATHAIVDLGVSKTMPFGDNAEGRTVKLAVNVDNLFDKTYFTEAFNSDANFGGDGFVHAVVGAPLSVTGSVTLKF
jgi:iron complex outermembrane receptor protein